MADIPLFPDESNMARFQDFVNIQKEISEHLLAQKHLYADIGRINKVIEDKLIARRSKELDMLNLIQKQNVKYNELVAKRGTLSGQAAKDLENDIDATLQLIEYNRKLIDLSKLASSMEVEMAKKQYEEDNKYYKFASSQLKSMFGLQVKEYDYMRKTGDELVGMGVKGEMFANTIGAVLMMLKSTYELFNKLDKAAWDFRKAMGMTRLESAVIRKDVQRIAIDNMAMGVTIESTYKSYQALGKAVGGVHNVTKAMAEDVAIMAAQLGISEETSAGFLRNMAAISKHSMESQTSLMYTAQSMSAAAGVPLEDVMKNVASRSTQTLTMMSRVPTVALRSAIELQRMGTSLDQAAKSSRHILDFTENVNEEMEASVLLGRSINLQKAREMAYNRNLEGSTKEILRISKSVNFENLDVFQQEAFAKATGKSVDELLKMLQTDRQLESVKRRGTPEQKAQLALYEKMRKENEATAKIRAKDASVLLRTMNNQTRLAAISAKWNQILAQAEEFLLPIVDNMLALVLPAMDIARGLFAWSGAFKVISPVFGKIVGLFGKAITYFQEVEAYGLKTTNIFSKLWYYVGKISWTIGEWASGGKKAFSSLSWVAKIRGWFSPLSTLGKVFGTIGGWFAKIGGWLGKIFAPIGKLLGFAGKFGGFIGVFAKWIPIIGWVITAFQFISNLFKRFSTIGFVKGDWLGNIWKGIKAIGLALYDTLIQPFVDAFKWIMHFFGGKSPSLLGMYIVKGIVSIGSLLFKAITLPWKLAFMAITKLGPIVGKLIWKGITMYFHMWKTLGTAVFSGAKYLGSMILHGVSSVKDKVINVIKHPFQSAMAGVKAYLNFGGVIVKGIASIGRHIFDAIVSPFKMAFKWVIDKFSKIPLIGKLFGSGVEKKATAAYVPAVKVTPKGTEVAPFTRKPGEKGKDEKEASQPMSEATGQKICSLLEKILAKDNNIHMDGQLLSTHLARQTEFRGGYGVNKVA